MMLEEMLAMGVSIIRIITSKPALHLVQSMKYAEYLVADVPASSGDKSVNVVFTFVKRRAIKELVQLIKEYYPGAFLLHNLLDNYLNALAISGILDALEEKWFEEGAWLFK